jgi:dTDP-4-dehydrorhamnose 3,5-epimerase
MSFIIKPCPLNGLFELEPKVFKDERGYFFESYSEKDFAEAGLQTNFVQDNQSFSTRGVLRGLNFQKKYPQTRVMRVITGEVYDVAVDVRANSPTFGKWHGSIINAEKQNQMYIPEGFAHAYLILSENAIVSYKCSGFYHSDDRCGIIYNDPNLNIDWPKIEGGYILSEQDKKYPSFNEIRKELQK